MDFLNEDPVKGGWSLEREGTISEKKGNNHNKIWPLDTSLTIYKKKGDSDGAVYVKFKCVVGPFNIDKYKKLNSDFELRKQWDERLKSTKCVGTFDGQIEILYN